MRLLTLFPGKGINDIRFGNSVNDLPTLYNFVFSPYLSAAPLETKSYVSESLGLRADFLADQLRVIACSKSIFLDGEELIGSKFWYVGRKFSRFKQIRDKDEILTEDSPQHVVYVDDLGLSFWIDRSDIIKSIDCMELGGVKLKRNTARH